MWERRRAAAALGLWIAAGTLHGLARTPRSRPVTQAEVDRITREAILIDTHDDVTSRTVTGYDIGTPNQVAQTDLQRMRGVLGAEFFAIYVDASYVKDNHAANRAMQMIDMTRTDIIGTHPQDFAAATSAAIFCGRTRRRRSRR